MCTVFWDRQGILVVEFVSRGEIINALRYCQTLRKLCRAIQNYRHGMLSEGIVNARPYSTGVNQNLIEEFCRSTLCSPNLASSDNHVFIEIDLKCDFGGRHFDNNEDAKNGVH